MPIFKFKNERLSAKSNPFAIQEEGGLKLDKFSYRLAWTEESFTAGGGLRETVGRFFNFNRIRIIAVMILALFGLLFGRTAWLQLVRGEYYYQLAEGNRIRISRVEARRGIIYDRAGQALSANKANFLLYFIPADLPKDESGRDTIIGEVSKVLAETAGPISLPTETEKALTETEVKDIIKTTLDKVKRNSLEAYQPLFIADKIQYDKAMVLALKSSDWPGVVLTSRSGREYRLPSLSTSHLLGYTGKISETELASAGGEYQMIDYVGKTGLEYFWENELKGVTGKKQIEVDALGREKKILNSQKAVDGHSLLLSLDSAAQAKLEELLSATLAKARLKRGSAIVLDPNNGEVLAMISLPAYDDNLFARGITGDEYQALLDNPDRPLFNRAVSGEFPSGSTIKPVMAAAALQEGIINEHTTVLSTGGISVGQWFFPDWRAGGHGSTDVRKALAQSVNTFFYYIGGGYQGFKGLGVERIVRYEKMFGLSEQTGIDLPAEATGFLPSMEWKKAAKGENWYIGDTYHLSIGQGDLTVTPLQVADYTAVFANGGKLFRPHLVKAILSNDDKVATPVEIIPVRSDFISPQNINIVREGMRQTVVSGSARSLSSVPVEVAGKTGTAQWSTKKPTHAWFTGFAPYDQPQVVITILIEEGGEGSSIAVPIARDFLTWYFQKKDIKP
jgi:penicillin-binding protein 2